MQNNLVSWSGESINAGVSGVEGLVNELLAMTRVDKNVTKAVNEVSFIEENRANITY